MLDTGLYKGTIDGDRSNAIIQRLRRISPLIALDTAKTIKFDFLAGHEEIQSHIIYIHIVVFTQPVGTNSLYLNHNKTAPEEHPKVTFWHKRYIYKDRVCRSGSILMA